MLVKEIIIEEEIGSLLRIAQFRLQFLEWSFEEGVFYGCMT
jgi:hypothetical protein